MSILQAFISGFLLSFSLIMAIGAQNAFVLRQGLKNEHVLAVVLVCALSDTLLILAGIWGFSEIVAAYPDVVTWARWAGAVFLVVYGAMHLHSAFKSNDGLTPSQVEKSSLWAVIAVCLSLTWLNPHVYLDTVFLIGSVSTKFSEHLMAFGVGAVLASWVFFFSLGFGAKLLRPVFEKPRAWQVLDILIWIVMWSIAASLIVMD